MYAAISKGFYLASGTCDLASKPPLDVDTNPSSYSFNYKRNPSSYSFNYKRSLWSNSNYAAGIIHVKKPVCKL